jgi:hypothetical protein
MDQIFNALAELVGSLGWPWYTAVGIFTIIGQFTSLKLFTRARAYDKTNAVWTQHVWWWGRETLMLHPIAAGAALGLLWKDPDGTGLSIAASSGYFAGAGVASLFAYMVLKGYAKKKGIDLVLPGTSVVPKLRGE